MAVLALLAGLARDGLALRRELRQVRADVRQAQRVLAGRSVGDQQVRAVVGILQHDTGDLHRTTGSLFWRLGSHTPLLGGTLRSVRSLALSGDVTTHRVLPVLVDVALAVRSGHRSGPLDVSAISRRGPALQAARDQLTAARRRLAGDDLRDPTVRRAHAEVTMRLEQVDRALAALTAVARIGPAMTGQLGERHYLVLLQTPSESRATGGLVGGFLELQVAHGRVSVVRSGTNHNLRRGRTKVPVTGGFAELWGPVGAEREWFASNLSLDLPTVSRVWAGLYRQQYGVAVDGVLGVTPEGIGHLLRATGPLQLPDGQRLTAAGAAHTLEVSLYARYPLRRDEAARNAYQLAILAELSAAFLRPRPVGVTYVKALAAGAADGSFRLASTHLDEQAQLQKFVIAGALPRDGRPFVAWSTQNSAGTKLDVYVHRSLSFRRGRASHGRQAAVATAVLRNDAPTSGLPAYVVDRADGTPRQRAAYVKGSEKLAVATYLMRGATVRSVTVDGRAATVTSGSEQGYPVVVVPVVLLPGGGSSTVVVTLEQPAAPGPVATLQQPVSQPDSLSLR